MDETSSFRRVLYLIALYTYGIYCWFLYLGLSVYHKSFFKKQTEQDRLQLAIARDQFWNLSKSPIPDFDHRFYTLRNGVKLHYITNHDRPRSGANAVRNMAIFIHGFPDSSMIWRFMLQTAAGERMRQGILVCVDLPGYGGSDSLDRYGPEEVLEALAEFIVAMRENYLEEEVNTGGKTYIIGHDWGSALAFRLASEAPGLADRFIVANGPHFNLVLANADRILKSSRKIFRQFRQAPRKNWACLSKAYNTARPLIFQAVLFGYMAAFQLPPFMVKYLGTGGNSAFLRGSHRIAYGKDKSEYNVQEAMAATLGPSVNECKTQTLESEAETYGESVVQRAKSKADFFWEQTSYYRDGVATDPWVKSLETIADLHNIESAEASISPLRRRSSSSASSALFGEQYKGSLRAPTTVLWGQRDQACTQAICLDGIGDYLARESQVVLLPRTGHWTPVEKESREAFVKVLEQFVVGGSGMPGVERGGWVDVEKVVKGAYEGATILVKK